MSDTLPTHALSIRQPWAWLILHGGKDIENRSWYTHRRGPILIHASQGMTKAEYQEAQWTAEDNGIELPPFDQLQRGGIIGQVEIVDCLTHSTSPWYFGQYGFLLKNPKPLPFQPCKGSLGFFTPNP
jgi:hypothetical protein